jgi:hypothetical protein
MMKLSVKKPFLLSWTAYSILLPLMLLKEGVEIKITRFPDNSALINPSKILFFIYLGPQWIDFRNIFTIHCGLIKRAEQMGANEVAVIDSKCLQLSDASRAELRDKVAYYFGRVPDEDFVVNRV